MPYLGHMTLTQDAPTRRTLKFGIRDRLRLAREDAYPGMDKTEFSVQVLGAGKNIATAYESKTGTGTREENMKPMILAIWATKCRVDIDWLRHGERNTRQPETRDYKAPFVRTLRPGNRTDSRGPAGRTR